MRSNVCDLTPDCLCSSLITFLSERLSGEFHIRLRSQYTQRRPDDHEQPIKYDSARFHSHEQGNTLQPFLKLTLIFKATRMSQYVEVTCTDRDHLACCFYTPASSMSSNFGRTANDAPDLAFNSGLLNEDAR